MHTTRTVSLAAIVWAVALATGAQARPGFVSLLPNGTRIDGSGCQNCHNSPGGGDARNAFGIDMVQHSNQFSAVCAIDSDGDGQTNGQELGDPDCIWTSGAAARTTEIANPGRPTSTSTNPLGGSPDADVAVSRACPAHATSIVTGCLCDDGFGPEGNTCTPATGVGTTWMCDPSWLGDASCDCGCGAPDTDCADALPATCEYNDCDGWQPESGLTVDNSDTTRCAGGVLSGSPGGSIAGTCPAHATEGDSGACLCDSAFPKSGDACGTPDPASDASNDPAASACGHSASGSMVAFAVALFAVRRRRAH